jgi:hypothetical protein
MVDISTMVQAEKEVELIDANVEDTVRALKFNINNLNGLNDPKYRMIDLISGFDEPNCSYVKIKERLETAQKMLKGVPGIKLHYFEGTSCLYINIDDLRKLYVNNCFNRFMLDNSDDLSACLMTPGEVCERAAVLPRSYLKKQSALNGDDYILISLGVEDDAIFKEGINIIKNALTSEDKYNEYQQEKARSRDLAD